MRIRAKKRNRNNKKVHIELILYNEEIYNKIKDDTCPDLEGFKNIPYPYEDLTNVVGYVGGKPASLFVVEKNDRMHFMVLKEFRVYADKLLSESFKCWPFDVWVVIPETSKSVINFAKKNGFIELGIEKNEHLKCGVYYNSYILKTDRNNLCQ